MRADGLAQEAHGAAGRQEAAGRVLRVEAGFDGVAAKGRWLAERKRLAGRDPDLPFDQV